MEQMIAKIICKTIINECFDIKPIITEQDYRKLSDDEKKALLMTLSIGRYIDNIKQHI